jgi:ribosomal protein S18 acetylase RimI-like enzyme
MNITYRNGRKEDCLKLAEFVYIASDGVVEFLFRDLIDGVSPVQMVARNLGKDRGYYTFRNTIVAVQGSRVVGVSFYYPAREHVISDEMRNFFPADRLAHLQHVLSGRVESSLYIDTLCVDENYRGNGIGAELIALTQKKAIELGYNALSLIALADNTNAHRLYFRCGFEIVLNIEMAAHELIPHEGGAYLMGCRLA